mgnify:CR=1 FL=1
MQAARKLNVSYADVYTAFLQEYTDNPQAAHYGDRWHPGACGHEIYFEEIKIKNCTGALNIS